MHCFLVCCCRYHCYCAVLEVVTVAVRGVVTVVAGAVITVNSLTSGGLPAVAIGDVFAVQSTIRSDGMDYFSNYERLDVITRYNYVQFFLIWHFLLFF